MATLPVFFDEDASKIVSEIKADIEQRFGRQIADSDVEQLMINALAYREQLLRIRGNETARQMLVDFATGSMLDNLARLVGVSRLPASGAVCTIQLNMVEGNSGILLPAGIRIQSSDQKVIFITQDPVTIAPAQTTATVSALCTTAGESGNGYEAGRINIILDPQPFLSTATNTDTSTGGSDQETDLQLRERIVLAPSTFSVAGPRAAYIYFAKSANPAIIDVQVDNDRYEDGDDIPDGDDIGDPIPGTVNIYPLLEGGVIPGDEVLEQVEAVCDDEKVRPLNDIVRAVAPTKIEYAIVVNITLYEGADQTYAINQITAALNAYQGARKNKLAIDIKRAQISARCVIKDATATKDVVYDVEVASPADDIVVAKNEFTFCTGVTVNIIGTNEG